MKIEVSFDEISEYVKEHYGQTVTLSAVSDKEFCIAYNKKVLIANVKVSVNILIEEVQADSVTVAYKGGIGVDAVIAGVLTFLKKVNPLCESMLIKKPDHRLQILLYAIPQAETLLKTVALSDITLSASGITVSVKLL